MSNLRTLSCAAGALAAALMSLPALAGADSPTLEERIELLAEKLEAQRVELNIPGMAIAIVKDDEVIMARGFGVRDVDNQIPVDEHTTFAIGSSTKAFTAALVAMLVDEGAMDWDDPIRKHLPEFLLHDPEIAEQVTLRDTLSHRTGLSRTDLLWIAGHTSRAEILQAVAGAELYSPFRKEFHYNNIMFLAAGQASARVAGTDWDSMLADRLFDPLGMDSSSSTYAAAQADSAMSKGYDWEKQLETYLLRPMRKLDGIAPAGSINSNVLDMTKWVRLQLNRGEIDGRRLISQEQIEQMWSPAIELAPGVEYGLGWFVQTWNGKRLIEHGGNIDGFAASVSLLPDDNIGFVLLTNVSHTPLQAMCHGLVYGTLLGDDAAPAIDGLELEHYVGRYHFAPMEDYFTVLVKEGALAVDVPGQMAFELKPPDDEGKWYFAMTDTIAVSFEQSDDDDVTAMKLYQSGMTFDLPREGVEPELKVDMEQVGPLLGSYTDTDANMTVKVLIQNGRLAVDVPGQMVYELHNPDDDGRWVLRVTDAIHVTFEHDDEADEPVLVMHQGGVATRMPRAEGDDAAPVPSVDELLELVARGHNSAAAKNIKSLKIEADLKLVHQGVHGTVTTYMDGPQRLRDSMDLGRFGHLTMTLVGDEGWMEGDIRPPSEHISEESHDEMRTRHPLALFGDWRETFDDVQVQPSETVNDRPMHVVLLTVGTARRTIYIDAETGEIVRERVSNMVPGVGRMSQRVDYEQYTEVDGLKLPSRIVTNNDMVGRMEMTIRDVQANVEIPEGLFTRPG